MPRESILETRTMPRAMPLSAQVSQVIQDKIFRGELRPGDKLVEAALAKQLGVTQIPLREALIELEQLGFVERIPNKTARVTEISPEQGRKILAVRTALELLALKLIFARFKDKELDLSSLEDHLTAMREAARKGDLGTFNQHDFEFHRAYWQWTGNEFLVRALERLVAPYIAILALLTASKPLTAVWADRVLSQHEEIMEVLRKRSLQQAEEILTRQEEEEGILRTQISPGAKTA